MGYKTKSLDLNAEAFIFRFKSLLEPLAEEEIRRVVVEIIFLYAASTQNVSYVDVNNCTFFLPRHVQNPVRQSVQMNDPARIREELDRCRL